MAGKKKFSIKPNKKLFKQAYNFKNKMLTKEQVKEIKRELDECDNPLFFFHDDPDGLCSFLLLYKYKQEGAGVVVKAVPRIDEKFLKKVKEYSPDKIFITDIAIVEQDFIDRAGCPVVWIDHHEPLKRNKVKYFNPRNNDKDINSPATLLCYQVTKEDLWIAMTGCVGDWVFPPFYDEFKEKYPDLVNDEKDPGAILFSTKIGELSKIFSFILKGKISDVMKCVKILTRIESPYEILRQETPRGKLIYKLYERVNKKYEALLKKALKKGSEDSFLIFTYEEDKTSFTGDLANELHYRFPDKFLILGREKGDEIRMSLRSKLVIPPILEKALQGLEGYGGGHEHACGACVKKDDFELFVKRLRDNIK